MIIEPHTISPDATGHSSIRNYDNKKLYWTSCYGEWGKLLGIITMRDLRYEKNLHFKI